jgi:uncharacterized membrane protein
VFASIAGYWVIHNGNFHYIHRGDGRIIVLSLVNLIFVTLLPLAASIVGAHPLDPLATIFLSANSALYCISSWAIWSYASANPQLVLDESDCKKLNRVGRIMLLVSIGLVLAIPLAYLNIYLAYIIWIFYAPSAAWWSRARWLRSASV